MRICYFGTYEPEYSRNRTLILGLRENGVEVVECQERFEGYKKFLTLKKVLREKHAKIGDYDAMIVGYPGHWIMPLAKKIARGPIIFDAFISFYGGLLEKKTENERGYWWKKYWYYHLDKNGCLLADRVLLDTKAHIKYFLWQFDLLFDKFARILVGTDERLFYPRKSEKLDDKFRVLLYAKFIPLHGGNYVVEAAKLLENEKNIEFTFIGGGKGYDKCRALARKLKIKNIIWQDKIPYKELPKIIASHDVSLGIFGGTKKAGLVIPNKVYEAMAMKKPFITGDSVAMRELLTDKKNALFCQMANASDLAKKIIELKNNQMLREGIARGGRETFKKNATSLILGRQLKDIILQLLKRNEKT